MGKIRRGNKQNSFINGEWGASGNSWLKRFTSKKRRRLGKTDIDKRQSDEL